MHDERSSAERGFTLIELLITLTLMAVVGGTVTAIFAGGARVWERFQQSDVKEQWVLLTLEQIDRDLRNARRFSLIPFEGTYDEVSFPLLVAPSAQEAGARELGRAGFFFNDRQGMMCRSRVPYRQMRSTRLRDMCQELTDGLGRVRFEYFGAETAGGDPRWVTSWKQPTPPLAVKVELSYRDATTKNLLTHSRIVHLPTAQ